MRQLEWRLLEVAAKGIPLGRFYLFAMQSTLDWWTLSQELNDMGDLQRNVHWPRFLLMLPFSIGLWDGG
jgi:hypothetical protein